MPYKDPNSEAARASQKRRDETYRKSHPEYSKKYAAHKSQWAKTEHARRLNKSASLKCRFGITLEQRDKMIEEQAGLCLICKQPLTLEGWGGPAVDHCHDTGVVRGILHRSCNAAIGLLRDDSKLLRFAAEYLEKRHVS